MLVGERQADESNRRRSPTLRTAYVFLVGNALISDRRAIAICWKYGLTISERQIPETLLWRMSLT
jgi:hypothetical protein